MPTVEPVVEHRRTLHQIPELDRTLPETLAYVKNILSALPCHVFSPTEGSVCAWFDAGRDETVAFRADMDALPITEATGLPYASRHPGLMHACGHDGHTAMALALAQQTADLCGSLPRNVLFVFQPAEETTGGAKALCESGIFETYRVRRIFGLHLWPDLPAGTVWSRPGPQMASASELRVEVGGKSVHLSKAAQGRDALLAGAEYLLRVYAMAEQELPEGEPRVLKFGKMTSGTVRNAISDHTELLGSLRTYSEATAARMKRRLTEIGHDMAEKSGCTFSIHAGEGYPPVRNDEALLETVRTGLCADAPGFLPEPALAAEDFSFYQKIVPGVFFFLGVGASAALHSPQFCFDDKLVLPAGVSFLKKLMLLP